MKKLLSQTATSSFCNSSEPVTSEVQVVINTCFTQYEILNDVAANLNMVTNGQDEADPDWDIWFIDGPVVPSLLTKMKPH